MSEPFDIENERIEILDDEGNKLVFKPMAVIGTEEEIYYVFGAMVSNEEEHKRQLRLMLVRREEEEGQMPHYVICENHKDIEQIVGSYLRHTIKQAVKAKEQMIVHEAQIDGCDIEHGLFEFCYCDQPDYLQ